MERDWLEESGNFAERIRAFPGGTTLLKSSATWQEGGVW
jgi:hypothetical protein